MEHLAFLRHIKKLVILAILTDKEFVNRLVLKGGNLLDVVYEISARASVDVDLSMDVGFDDVEVAKEKISHALETTFAQHGFVIFDLTLHDVPPKMSDEMKDFWGGYKVEFKLIDIKKFKQFEGNIEQLRRNAANIGKKDSTKFKVDISRHEFCDEKIRYSVDDCSIFGYSPAMFVAEKVRAICQQMKEYAETVHLNPRARARDFLDIFIMAENHGVDFADPAFHATVKKIFDKKRCPLHLVGEIKNVRDQHEDDFAAVQATVDPAYDLQGFGFYFDYVCKQSDLLEPLWNK